MKAKVVITKGWNGGEVIKETVVSGANRNMLDAKASKWIRANAPDPRHIRPCWTMTIMDNDVTIVDYGSYTYFVRFTVLRSDSSNKKTAVTPKRKINMTKKKPYSRIETGKSIRKIETELKRDLATLSKKSAPDWYVRLVAEFNTEVIKLLKLRDFLSVKVSEDSEVLVSDEARAMCPKAFKLLLKQEKAMTTFCRILKQRIELGWPKTPGVCECKKADAKKADAKKADAKKADAKKAK